MSTMYAASCNPPRTAKHGTQLRHASPTPSETSSDSEYAPEPRRMTATSPKLSKSIPGLSPDPAESSTSTSKTKRGRKPAAQSRSAREAQRKLNHSIIEKARRTKINDALATLKQLVPPSNPHQAEENDAEDPNGGGRPQQKKGSGKREEKEKEFKLEILVRTVSYMQDLVQRVAQLEDAVQQASCSNCVARTAANSRKRKHSADASIGTVATTERPTKRERPSQAPTPDASPVISYPSGDRSARLPSISSWLPEPPRASPHTSPVFQSHLPSPPSSTQFAAVRAPSQQPPALSLGPVATHSHVMSNRTPEEESAASLLLEIRGSSPTSRKVQTPATLLGLLA